VGARQLETITQALRRTRPELEDPETEISAGNVLVNGVPRTNPRTQVRRTDSITLRRPTVLRGGVKLGHALEHFAVPVHGRVAVDAGASAGGFVQTLLGAGAARVYAVEVGFGQLLGSLRQDDRVVNLERTNVADLSPTVIPDEIGVVTLDLGFLALAVGVPQLNALKYEPAADLVALVKPMAELQLSAAPTDDATVEEAGRAAAEGIEGAGWEVQGLTPSPIRGSHGAVELLLHARRR